MKFFHLSDLHIGLKLLNRDLAEDQAYILDQIIELARRQRPDAILIAGDIYDKAVPSAEAVELFDRFVRRCTEAVPQAQLMVISGNHDSAPRINLYRGLLCRQHVHMIGLPPLSEGERIEKVTLQDAFGPVNFYLLPFVRPSMVRNLVGPDENGGACSYDETLRRMLEREQIDRTQRNVLVSHQFYLPRGARAEDIDRMDSEVCTVGNIDAVDAGVLAPFDYAALGHIHKPMQVGGEFCRYCGTPLACSVSEAGQQKGVVQVELGPKGVRTATVLPLTPLRAVRVLKGTLADVLLQRCRDYVSVVLTDPEDLDVLDLQDRLREAFPCLLDVRREQTARPSGHSMPAPLPHLDAMALCQAFLGEVSERETALLQDVINRVKEAQ